MSFQTWLDSIHLHNILYTILVRLLTLGQKLYFQLKNSDLFHPSCFLLWQYRTLFWKSEKRNHQMQQGSVRCFTRSIQTKFTSSNLNLLIFQVKTDTAWDSVQLGSWCHNFRHLQHSCSSRAAVLLTSLENIAQNYLCHCFSYILKNVLLSYFYHSKSNDLRSSHSENLCVICREKG